MNDFIRVIDTANAVHYLGVAQIVDVDFRAPSGAVIYTTGHRANNSPLLVTLGPEETEKLRAVLDSRAGTTSDATPRVWSLDDE